MLTLTESNTWINCGVSFLLTQKCFIFPFFPILPVEAQWFWDKLLWMSQVILWHRLCWFSLQSWLLSLFLFLWLLDCWVTIHWKCFLQGVNLIRNKLWIPPSIRKSLEPIRCYHVSWTMTQTWILMSNNLPQQSTPKLRHRNKFRHTHLPHESSWNSKMSV